MLDLECMSDQVNQSSLPRWSRDLLRYLPLKSQFVLSGNVRDLFQVGSIRGNPILPLTSFLGVLFKEAGYQHFLRFDPARGCTLPAIPGVDPRAEVEFFQKFRIDLSSNFAAPMSVDGFFERLEQLVAWRQEPVVIFADFAARMVVRADTPTACEHQNFTRALVSSLEMGSRPFGDDATPYYNSIVWITEKEGDLPDWFVVGNPRVRQIVIPKPDHSMRRLIAPSLLRSLRRDAEESEEFTEAIAEFVDGTEGMITSDMSAIVQLMRSEGLGIDDISEAVRRYKLGVTEDPWKRVDRERLRNGEAFIHERVKGQDAAVGRMLDIVKRAVSGLTTRKGGLGRPRGVAFLAGPTGVGKTELAKTITDLLFGDESAYIRFDMSEFSAEHSDQRLIGAPPGYVGYDVGGELTNAVREKPFAVVLFDEIEKAHPRILDKFLQVLDDGVLTSGRGERVYFSETFILFTSNLGIYRMTESGQRELNVSRDEDYETVSRKVREEIECFFKLQLGRPEILNRIGENLLVFDFIRESVGREIFEAMVERFIAQVEDSSGITLELKPEAKAALEEICLRDLSNGGRGIRNMIEAHLINPVSREVFDRAPQAGQKLVITGLKAGARTELEVEIES